MKVSEYEKVLALNLSCTIDAGNILAEVLQSDESAISLSDNIDGLSTYQKFFLTFISYERSGAQ